MKSGLRRPSSVLRKRSKGQSIVLIALILAVLIGLVALSVDVGSTYAQQRATQRASDAAAVDGMSALLSNQSCAAIQQRIMDSLESHGFPKERLVDASDTAAVLQPGQRRLAINFMLGDKDNTPVSLNSCIGSGTPPANARYIRVSLDGVESTNFATLFGRNDLPVNADAYSKRTICPPVPIGLAADAFVRAGQIGSTYTDTDYRHGKPERRFFLRTDSSEGSGGITTPPGDFIWLSWMANTVDDAGAMEKALMPPGTTTQGYEEAPWDNIPKAKPDDYPNQPGIPNEFDVMYGARTMKLGNGYAQSGLNGNNGPGGDSGVATQMKWLVDNKVVINLPRYSLTNGTIGDKGHYLIDSFSSAMIVGYGYLENGDPNLAGWGKGWYLDLVDLGSAKECPQGETPSVVDQTVTLKGNIAITPVYGSSVDGRKPLDIVVVLDASGSMNWTWEGKGSVSSTTDASLAKLADKDGTIDCVGLLYLPKGCQSFEAYKDYKQRRLYQAKQTVKDFLINFNWHPDDRAAIVTYSGDKNTPGGNVRPLPKAGLQPLEFDGEGKPSTLVNQMINEAGTMNPMSTDPSELYTTLGASPGAQALQTTKKILDGSGSEDRNRVVIFLTDGLLNVDLKGVRSKDESIEANYDSSGAKKLPINLAIQQAGLIKSDKNSKNATIYVVAMGNTFDQSGLADIASSTQKPFFVTVRKKSDLDDAFRNITGQILDGPCVPMQESAVPVVPSADRTFRYTAGGYVGETDRNGLPSLGVVTAKSGSNILAKVPIKPDGTFEIPGLLPNSSVTLSFNNPGTPDLEPVFYQGLDEPVPFYHNYDIINDTGNTDMPVYIKGVNFGTTQFVHPVDNGPVVLKYTGPVCPPPKS